MEGCVNTLNDDCKRFYADIAAKDGSNDTSKAVYPCHYDENNVSLIYI